MNHVVVLPARKPRSKQPPAKNNGSSLALLVDHSTVGNIGTMDALLWRALSLRPELEARRMQYLANVALILDICGDPHKRQYMTKVLTAFQERNLCHSEFEQDLPQSSFMCDDDRQRLETILQTAQEDEANDGELEEDASDNALVMHLTQQNNQLKRKNKENRKTLQLRKKQRHDKLIKERMLSGRQDDIFNMFKRICQQPDEPQPERTPEPPRCPPDPNAPCTMKHERTFVTSAGVESLEDWRPVRSARVQTNFDESDELFCSMYWTMIRRSEGYGEHIADCIADYENRQVMAEHVEVVCPSCNRKELVHCSKFSSTWSCKHCGFYFSGVTANTETAGAEADGDGAGILQEMRELHEQEMNRESALLNDIYTGCDYKTRQEYEYNRGANRLNHEKHRINFQNYLREFLHPNLELMGERHLELVRREMELDNGRQPFESWEDINMTKLEQTLKRLHMKMYTKNMFTVVTLLAQTPPPLLTNNLFDMFMDHYRKLSVAFLECKLEGWCERRTMIRNCFVFEQLCETFGVVCFRKFYRKVKCAKSMEDHRQIYAWCCERAGLAHKSANPT